MQKKRHIGSSFDDFLKEEGIYAEVTARAIKRVRARQAAIRLRRQKEVGAAFGKYRWRGNLARSRKGRGTG